MGGSIWW